MRLSCRLAVGALVVLESACSAVPQGTLGGEPVASLAPLAAGTSCPSLVTLQRTTEGRITAVLAEQTATALNLGQEHLDGTRWLVDAQRPVAPGQFLSASVTPEGAISAASFTHDALEPFEFTRVRDGRWESVPFDLPLDSSRQNFPQVVALDADRAVLTVWQTGGTAPSFQRAYLLSAGTWTALQEWTPVEVRQTFHRGPAGQLWRITYEGAEGAGEARFEEWTGAAWAQTGLTVATGALGIFRGFLPTPSGFTAFFDSTHSVPGGYGGTVYEVSGTSAVRVADLPSPEVGMIDLGRDSAGRLIVTAAGLSDGKPTVRVLRLADGAWQTVVDGIPSTRMLDGQVAAAVDGDSVLIGWTESDQAIDIGFQRYTDCRLRMTRLPL